MAENNKGYMLSGKSIQTLGKVTNQVLGGMTPLPIRDWSYDRRRLNASPMSNRFDLGIMPSGYTDLGTTSATRQVVIFDGTYVYPDASGVRQIATVDAATIEVPVTSASTPTYHHVYLKQDQPSNDFEVATVSADSLTDYSNIPVTSFSQFMFMYSFTQVRGNIEKIVTRFRSGGNDSSADNPWAELGDSDMDDPSTRSVSAMNKEHGILIYDFEDPTPVSHAPSTDLVLIRRPSDGVPTVMYTNIYGLPPSGYKYQVLQKNADADYDVVWDWVRFPLEP